MSIQNLYVVRDDVAEKCSNIYHAVNDKVALRNHRESLEKSKYPEDFSLIRVGTFDDERGKIIPDFVLICTGLGGGNEPN